MKNLRYIMTLTMVGLVVVFDSAMGDLNLSGDYHFHLCDPVHDERLLPLAVNDYDAVHVDSTTHALDFCEEAFDLNWRIENRMHVKICVLDNTRVEPLVRVDKVLSTRKMPKDPHNIALEAGLKEALPLVTKLSFQGDLIVLENDGGNVCVALEKVTEASQDGADNN